MRSFRLRFPLRILRKEQYIVPLVKKGRTKRTTYCPLHKTFFDKCAVYRPVHLPFLHKTHTPRHRITFSQRLSFSIYDPDMNGTYPENAYGMVLLFQSIIVYGEQLNERMYENNEQNLSNAEIVHNKSIQDRRRDKKQKKFINST